MDFKLSEEWKMCGLSLDVAKATGFTEAEMQRLLAFLKRDREHELQERLQHVPHAITDCLVRDTGIDPFVPISPTELQSAHGYFLLPLVESETETASLVLVLPPQGAAWQVLRWRFYGVLMRWLSFPDNDHCSNTIKYMVSRFAVSSEHLLKPDCALADDLESENATLDKELVLARSWEANLRMVEINSWYQREGVDCPVCDWPHWIIPKEQGDRNPEVSIFVFPVVDGSSNECCCLISVPDSAEPTLSAGAFDRGEQLIASGDWLAQQRWLQGLYEEGVQSL